VVVGVIGVGVQHSHQEQLKDLLLRRAIPWEGQIIAADAGAAAVTAKGLNRTEQQDRAAVVHWRRDSWRSSATLGVVVDGIGGAAEGGRAAAITVSSIVSHCVCAKRSPSARILRDALNGANRTVNGSLKDERGGAAVVVLLWSGGNIWIGQAGDARVYTIDKNNGAKLITQDQTLEALAKGTGRKGLLNYVGMGADFEATVQRHSTRESASFLLTSDGAHSVPGDVIQYVVRTANTAGDLAFHLVQASSWRQGGLDNATALAVVQPPGRGESNMASIWLSGERIVFPLSDTNDIKSRAREQSPDKEPTKHTQSRSAKPRDSRKEKPPTKESAPLLELMVEPGLPEETADDTAEQERLANELDRFKQIEDR